MAEGMNKEGLTRRDLFRRSGEVALGVGAAAAGLAESANAQKPEEYIEPPAASEAPLQKPNEIESGAENPEMRAQAEAIENFLDQLRPRKPTTISIQAGTFRGVSV